MLRTPTCPNCLKNYVFQDNAPLGPGIPLTLQCSHTFCEGCLIQKTASSKEIECSVCKDKTFVNIQGKEGVKQLMPNIYLLGLLSLNKRLSRINTHQNSAVSKFRGIPLLRQKVTENGDDPNQLEESSCLDANLKPLCDECTMVEATCLCMNCDQSKFCNNCFQEIHRAKVLKCHKALPLELSRAVDEKDRECRQHQGRRLEFYDKELDTFLCACCLISDTHKGHIIVHASDLEAEGKTALKECVDKANEQLSIFEYSKKVIRQAMPEITMDANQILQDIQAHFTALHALLQKRELELLEDAMNKYSENSGLDSMYQDLNKSSSAIAAAIREGEMGLKKMPCAPSKQEEVIQRLENFKTEPCYAERNETEKIGMSFLMKQEHVDMFKEIGSIQVNSSRMFSLKTIKELTEDEIEFAKTFPVGDVRFRYRNLQAPEGDTKEKNNELPFIIPESKIIHAIRASYERVLVTHIRSPTDFSIRRCSDNERFVNMMTALNRFCKKSESTEDLVFNVAKGDLVCAQFTDDNEWYRAVITKDKTLGALGSTPTWENGLSVEVFYIDFGNSEWASLPRLRRMKEEFLDVPELAVPCSFCDIVPPGRGNSWPDKSIKALTSLIGNRTMLMNVRYRHEGRLFVDLRRPDDDEPTLDDDRPVSVRDALVFLEVACFRSSYSVPHPDITKPTKVYKDMKTPDLKDMLDVIVTFVNSPDSIFVQKYDNTSSLIHKDLKKLYSGRGRDSWAVTFPYRNLVCAARFSEDKRWYRGLITYVHENNFVDVLYVDFGNTEKVGFSDIRRLPDTWLHIPKQAMEVRLKDVVGLNDGKWSEKAIRFLNEAILNKPMVMITKEIGDNGVLLVELCDTSTDEDVYINSLLVEKEMAISIGPSSEKRAQGLKLSPERREDVSEVDDLMEALKLQKTYQDAYLPLDKTSTLTGVFVDNNGHIFAHVASDYSVLSSIMDDLNADGGQKVDSFPQPESIESLSIRQACVAKFTDDGLWYRAMVIGIVDNESVKVDFVDFGNQDNVSFSELRVWEPFIDIPKQAVELELHSIVPNSPSGSWTEQALSAVYERIVNKEFTAECLKSWERGHAFPVTVTLNDGTDLTNFLVQNGLALHEVREEKPVVESRAALRALYSPPLPSIGVPFDVIVTQVDKEDIVYVQRLPSSDNESRYSNSIDDTLEEAERQVAKLRELSAEINTPGFFQEDSIIQRDQIKHEMLCCVLNKGDGAWYRAQIKRILKGKEQDKVEVLYLDYGLSDVASISDIRAMPQKMAELPRQAIRCRLSGIKLPMTDNEKERRQLAIEAMKKLFSIVENKRLIAVILERGPVLSILLYDRVTVTESESELTEDVLVAKEMARHGVVLFEAASIESDFMDSPDTEQAIGSSPPRRSSTKMLELPVSSDPEAEE